MPCGRAKTSVPDTGAAAFREPSETNRKNILSIGIGSRGPGFKGDIQCESYLGY